MGELYKYKLYIEFLPYLIFEHKIEVKSLVGDDAKKLSDENQELKEQNKAMEERLKKLEQSAGILDEATIQKMIEKRLAELMKKG